MKRLIAWVNGVPNLLPMGVAFEDKEALWRLTNVAASSEVRAPLLDENDVIEVTEIEVSRSTFLRVPR